MEYLLVTFINTHYGIALEGFLLKEGLKINIIPTPTSITKSCGISIRALPKDIDIIKKIAINNEISINIYMKTKEGYKIV